MSDNLNAVLSTIQTQGIRWVRFIWSDNAGLIRAKAVHTAFLDDYLKGDGVGIAAAQQALPVMYDAPSPGSGLTPAGEVHMRADWATFTPLPYAPGHARVITDIYDGDQPWGHCPRSFLAVRRAEWEAMKDLSHEEEVRLLLDLKSIAAYRTGLAVDKPISEGVAACFQNLRQPAEAGDPVRLACKPLNDWVVWAALEEAARRDMPVQFHTGFGDPDLDLRWASPVHMRPLFENPSFRRVPFVLLHVSYPFTREVGYLAAVYPNVHIDLGLAIPFLSVAGMRFVVRAFLELTPLSKIIFSTDAHLIAELFYLGALWGRRILAEVLEEAVRDGDLTTREAERAAELILRRNAIKLYGLPE
ncbi:MAG: amidohydrolase family protein [Anaerolineae bacterium]